MLRYPIFGLPTSTHVKLAIEVAWRTYRAERRSQPSHAEWLNGWHEGRLVELRSQLRELFTIRAALRRDAQPRPTQVLSWGEAIGIDEGPAFYAESDPLLARYLDGDR